MRRRRAGVVSWALLRSGRVTRFMIGRIVRTRSVRIHLFSPLPPLSPNLITCLLLTYLNHLVFVKGRQIDPLGNETSTAVQIGWCLRKFIDAGSKSDILDFSLSRSSRPPSRSEPGSDDSDL